jgi:hypothetical protein
MGNRVCIKLRQSAAQYRDRNEAICAFYLHWNGGRESTDAFFNATFDYVGGGDLNYFTARFTQVIGHYFGGSSSLGILKVSDVHRWEGGNDNPTIEYDINERVEVGAYPFFNHSTKEWSNNREKYEGIYKDCMAYFNSTNGNYEGDHQETIDGINHQIKHLLKVRKERKQKLKEKLARDAKTPLQRRLEELKNGGLI